jgi:hypothetical protein
MELALEKQTDERAWALVCLTLGWLKLKTADCIHRVVECLKHVEQAGKLERFFDFGGHAGKTQIAAIETAHLLERGKKCAQTGATHKIGLGQIHDDAKSSVIDDAVERLIELWSGAGINATIHFDEVNAFVLFSVDFRRHKSSWNILRDAAIIA